MSKSPLRVGIHNGVYKVHDAAGASIWQWHPATDTSPAYFVPPPPGLACWHCCHPFAAAVHPLPTAYDGRRKLYTFAGCFCGWGCVKAHNLEVNGAKYVHREICMHISRLMAHTSAPECAAAPPRTALALFGGPLAIAQFRARGASTSTLQGVRAPNPPAAEPTLHPSRAPRAPTKRGRGPESVSLEQLGFTAVTRPVTRPAPPK